MKVTEHRMIDVSRPEIVEVTIEKQTVWINVEGVCLFRAQWIKELVVEDGRSEK